MNGYYILIVTSFGGDIEIRGNDSLTNLTGLENLTLIGGSFRVFSNDYSLSSFTGLNNPAHINGDLAIYGNDALTNINGLYNVTSILGNINIFGNESLTSLSGLDNIDPSTIYDLDIYSNFPLSTYDVTSICNYLSNPNGSIYINYNATGCNSPEEVMEACDTATNVLEYNSQNTFTISPNPLLSTAVIEYTLHHNSPVTLKILDLSGREIVTLVNEVQQPGEQRVVFNGLELKSGVYFCVLISSEGIQTKKIIKL